MARPTRPHVRAARTGIATLEFIFVFPILLSIVAAIILIARADVHKIAVATAARNDAWQKRPDANPGDVLKLLNDPAQSEITGRSRSVVPRSSIFAGEFTADGRNIATGRPWDRKDLRFRPGQLHLVPHEAELALIVDNVPGLGAFLSTGMTLLTAVMSPDRNFVMQTAAAVGRIANVAIRAAGIALYLLSRPLGAVLDVFEFAIDLLDLIPFPSRSVRRMIRYLKNVVRLIRYGLDVFDNLYQASKGRPGVWFGVPSWFNQDFRTSP